MKTTKRTLTALAMVALLAPAIESCKKGEEDPAISMRTRDSRMTGTWKMVSLEESSTSTNTTTTTNDVNAEKNDKTSTTVTTTTFDGTNWTTVTKYDATENDTEVNPTASTTTPGTFTYPTETTKTVNDNSSTTVDSYTYEIKMYKDNTFTATRTSTAKSASEDNTTTYTPSSGSSVITGTSDDTTYSKAVPSSSVIEGVWYWLDSKKNKIEIVAGAEFTGKILRLSNKEIILEDAVSQNDDNTNVSNQTFLTYSKADNQFDTKSGSQTQNVKYSFNWMRTAKFEKVDNEDERAGE